MHRVPGVLCLVLVTAACSSVGGTAIRTGPVQMPAYSGPVAVYSSGQPPPGAVDLGLVEVHGAHEEGTVETLLPLFVRKVAEIGGDVAVLDGVRARFELFGRAHVETFYYTCGRGMTCSGTRVYSANDELMVVSMFGRAFSTKAAPGPDGLIPPAPPPGQEPQGPEVTP